jgi:hypothetical protein
MKKIIFFTLVITLIFTLNFPVFTYAAKKITVKKSVKKNVTAYSTSIPSLVKYRSDKKAIFLSFSNFNGIESASYSFTYETNNNLQGAGGNITASNNPLEQRELLFGTCSTSICTYHTNISNAKLVITAKYTNGKTISKTYKIKTYF